MIKIIQTKKTTLSYGINDSATTLKLDNLLKLDGTSVSASDIGDELQGTFAPGTSREEIFLIDGANVTVNSDGTVEITNVLRGRKEVSPYGSGGYACDHGAGEIVIFGNNPQLYDKLPFKANDETIAGEWTFTPLPRSDGGNATDSDQLVTYAQALAMATGTTSINRVVVAGNGGEVITAGQLLYLLVTDGEWYKCDADTAATVDNIILGIAQGAGTDGGAITNGVLLFGLDSNQTGLTTNTAYYAGNTAGSISSSVGTVEVSVGISRSTTSLLFYPRYNQQLTENQQDALLGNNTDIAVGTGNKYVTQTGLQKSAETYAADAQANDTYVITLDPVPTSLVNGMTLRFKANTANTGPATLNVNGLGALAIVTGVSTALATGDILANQVCEVIYNSTGTVWQLVNPVPITSSTIESAIYPYVPNTAPTYTGGYYTYEAPFLDYNDGGTYRWAGWTATTFAPASGGLGATGHTKLETGATGNIYGYLPGFSTTTTNGLLFSQLGTNYISIKARFAISAGSSPIWGFGFAEGGSSIYSARTTTSENTIRFIFDGTNFYSVTSINGGTNTNNQITGITATNQNIFEIRISSASVLFYINGVLKFTHTTSIPTVSNAIHVVTGITAGSTSNIYTAPWTITMPLTAS